MIFVRIQNDLHRNALVGVYCDGALQVDGAVRQGALHGAEHMEAQILIPLHLKDIALTFPQDGGIAPIQREGVHQNEGEVRSGDTLHAEQGVFAAGNGEEEKFMLVLEAGDTGGEGDHILFLIVDRSKKSGVQFQRDPSRQASTSIG